MIYAENVFICMVIPLGIAALFLKKGARSFCVALITGMVVCLLSAYVSGFFADYYSYDTRSAALFITRSRRSCSSCWRCSRRSCSSWRRRRCS